MTGTGPQLAGGTGVAGGKLAGGSGVAGIPAFSPLDIANLAIWLDASDAGSITSSSGDVSQWNDKSGGARHVVQATGGIQPRTGDATLDSKNVLSFAAGDALRFTPSGGAEIFTAGLSVFIVFRKTGTANTFEALPLNTDNAGIGRPVDRWSSSGANNVVVNDIAVPGDGSGFRNLRTQTSWCVYALVVDQVATAGASANNPIAEFVDGVSVDTDLANTRWIVTSQKVNIGARSGGTTQFTGDVAEIVGYGTNLGTTDRQEVEAYLAAKWGL